MEPVQELQELWWSVQLSLLLQELLQDALVFLGYCRWEQGLLQVLELQQLGLQGVE